jgi:hypothetical protein
MYPVHDLFTELKSFLFDLFTLILFLFAMYKVLAHEAPKRRRRAVKPHKTKSRQKDLKIGSVRNPLDSIPSDSGPLSIKYNKCNICRTLGGQKSSKVLIDKGLGLTRL